MDLNWICKRFSALSPAELYAIIKLRNAVFVVEQNCVFQDADDKDQECYHFMGWNDEGVLVAYTRLVPPGVAYEMMSIGRVVTDPAFRRIGAGRSLMQRSIQKCYELFGQGPIKIGAQLYLKEFYRSFGFEQVGDVYDEDGIDHIHMVLH